MKYDQHENCAKCGYPGKTVKFRLPAAIIIKGEVAWIEENLQLTCSRCGFKWTRDCLDKEEA